MIHKKRMWWVVAAGILLCGIHAYNVPLYEWGASLILWPVLQVQRIVVVPFTSWVYAHAHHQEMAQRMQSLVHENETLRADVVRLQALVDYAQHTQELADFRQQQQHVGTIVQILFKQQTSQGHCIWVDRGTRDGVCKDMVAVYKNNLLGKVVDVYPWYSKVQLITDAGCKVASYCAGTDVHGIHKGCNSDRNTVLSYVSHLDQLIEGDMIFSSGEGLVFPRGLLLGRIVSTKPDGLYQHVEVKSDVDMAAIAYCTLLDKGSKSL